MTEPLALVPLAAAAHGGAIDGLDASRLVAAGITLLRRCAPLVRVMAGRRSAILLPTSPAFLTALAASDGRGAVLVNPLAAPLEVAHQVRDAHVGAAFTVSSLAHVLPPGLPHVLLDDVPERAVYRHDGDTRVIDLGGHFGDTLAGDPSADGRNEEAAIVYTSAMAGVPLGAILTHRNLLANARATVEALGLERGDRVLAVLPFAHLFGFTVTLTAPLLAGMRVLTQPRFHPSRALAAIEEHEIALLVGVPSVYATLLHAIEQRGGIRTAPRVCICGGAPLATALQDRWADVTGVELRQGYGLTEAGPVCLFNRPSQPNARGSLGVPMPGVDVSIRDDAGHALPPGESGEICVAGDNVFAGYVSGGAGGLAREGPWLRTGDLGVMDPDGRVRFRGVRKTMFTRNGFNIYPREIERAVGELDGVRAVTARATPDPVRENQLVIDVVGSVSDTDVRAWCERRLASYKQPAEIYVRAG